ncbi:MAG TPA: hypothetical protein VGK19_22120 [Capsulimonadaceae bacterium]|jgi:hypothetical protein
MGKIRNIALFAALAAVLHGTAAGAAPRSLPTVGEWDGVTQSAHLETPYEDQVQSNVPFGIISYFNEPWRSYMDTWSAAQYEGYAGAVWNIQARYADAVGQILKESGIRTVRFEIGWGYLGWDDHIGPSSRSQFKPLFDMCRKYGIRPLILLNAHHGVPCPVRDVPVTLVVDAKKGDTTLSLAPGSKLREGYTGPMDHEYIAAFPLITRLDANGTAHLSAPLGEDLKAGKLSLKELKYQPFQGALLADGTPVPACAETYDGWLKYVAEVTSFAKESLGTTGAPNAGFDLEVWNELTFGSNFLDIGKYYEAKPKYVTSKNKWGYVYKKHRAPDPGFRPDATADFDAGDCYTILPMTIDTIADHRSDYPGLKVISGFANQWPWDSGSALWPNQAGFSRHYYTGAWDEISPKHARDVAVRPTQWRGVTNALGKFEGELDHRDWHTVKPGTVFIPTVTVGFPELGHSGFHSESLSRDVLPDSRYVFFPGHGRYTHNGDFHTAELWETETNYSRQKFFEQLIFKDGTIDKADPKAIALDEHIAAKCMLRQYVFHNHKGLKRLYLYCLGPNQYNFGMLPKRFLAALDETNGALTPAVRSTLPEGFAGLAWLAAHMDAGEKIDAPRPLKVTDVVEYKPRLVMAGDSTPAHPDRWNRDWFTFLPYQLSPNRYLIPYYVQTTDMSHVWNSSKGPLDFARWDMPEQEYDVTIENIRGIGAKVSCLDPLTMATVPASIASATPRSITVHLNATDYPRFLTVTESKPGPQIVAPKVELTTESHVRVSWQTNLPATLSVEYGADWVNRSTHDVVLKPGTTSFTIPETIKGVVAVRIKAEANGLTDVWPRWDEDPAGQIVVPGGEIKPTSVAAPPAATKAPEEWKPIVSLALGEAPKLTGKFQDTGGRWSMGLPDGAATSQLADGLQGSFARSKDIVDMRARWVAGGAATASSQLPFASSIDDASSTSVSLPSGVHGTLYEYRLTAAAHPGVANLGQMYLLLPVGASAKDLLVVSFSGSADAMANCRNTLLAIAASITLADPPR